MVVGLLREAKGIKVYDMSVGRTYKIDIVQERPYLPRILKGAVGGWDENLSK